MSILDDLNLRQANLELGRVQSDDEMMVVPITGPGRTDVATPEHLRFRSTTSYGTMVFDNTSPDRKPAIVPAHIMIRGKGAQDHAMSGSGVVVGSSQTFNDACCVEQRQGGYLSSSGNEQDILPATLRKAFLDVALRNKREYGKLWGRIKTWLKDLNISQQGGGAHIRYFYDTPQYKDALEQFAASFEPIPNQIGAVILFSGVPVGLEIMPSPEHWDAYWKLLIRGCYGAELIRLKELGKITPSALILPDIPTDADKDTVKKILTDFSNHLRDSIIPMLENIAVNNQQVIRQDGNMTTTLIKTDSGGGGDLISTQDQPVYLSLVL